MTVGLCVSTDPMIKVEQSLGGIHGTHPTQATKL